MQAGYGGSGELTPAEASETPYSTLGLGCEFDSGLRTMNPGGSNGNVGSHEYHDRVQSWWPDGAFAGIAGIAADAAALTGTSGPQTCTVTFDLSSFATAPNRLEDYDYLAIGFARKKGTAPAVTISNFALNGWKSISIPRLIKRILADDTDSMICPKPLPQMIILHLRTPDTGYQMDRHRYFQSGYSNSRTGTSKALVKSVLSNVDGFTDTALLGQVSTDPDVDLDSSGDAVYQDLTIDLSALSQFQNVSSATEFRIYISDDTNYTINHRIDDVVLSGLLELVQVRMDRFSPQIRLKVLGRGNGCYSGSIAGSASDPMGIPLRTARMTAGMASGVRRWHTLWIATECRHGSQIAHRAGFDGEDGFALRPEYICQ